MHLGHINLSKSMNGLGEHFVKLIEALDRQGVRQYVLVRNKALAGRVAIYDSVTIGPVTRAPVMAYCQMPNVDVAHIHQEQSAQAGLLLTLTRSIPYVLTRRSEEPIGSNPIYRSTISRSASLICPTELGVTRLLAADMSTPVYFLPDISYRSVNDELDENRIAAEHMRIYRRALDSWRIPALLL